MSLYDDLGVPADATPDEIKAAHRRAARKHHPDCGGEAGEFDRIQRAAMVLRDPTRRARYDATGECGADPDNTASQVSSMLCEAFGAVLAQCDIARQDIIALVKSALQEQLNKNRSERSRCKASRDRLAAAEKRLGHTGDRPNVIATMLAQQLAAHNQALAQLGNREGIIQEAIAYAGDFSWEVDQRPEEQVFHFVEFGSGDSIWGIGT